MTSGLVHASYSLPQWQAVKLTFFAPCVQNPKSSGWRLTFESSLQQQ